MQYHSNARTNINQREYIQKEKLKPSRLLGQELKVSHTTVCNWKKANSTLDKSCRPLKIHYTLSKIDQRIIIKLRDKLLFGLDDLLDVLSPYIERLNRTNLYRTLLRNKRNVFSREEKQKTKEFKIYDPGFLHIDIFDVPKINGQKSYCFLAVDRATRTLLLEVYLDKTAESAADFLKKCLQFFPFSIHTILTDNGRQFTMKGQKSFNSISKNGTMFEIICEIAGIHYRKTKPYHPWTNGMAERMVRTVKEHTIKREHYLTLPDCINALNKFQVFHNFYRKLRVLKRKTPFEKICEYYQLSPNVFLFSPTEWKQCSETLHIIHNS
jgi:transposase-like protein